jgi:hypothetical protein
MAFPYICKNTSNCFFGLFQSLDQQLLKIQWKSRNIFNTISKQWEQAITMNNVKNTSGVT